MMSKRILSLLAVLMLVFSMGTAVFAHDVPDMTRKGSIEITMRCGQTAVGGGTLTLYRVGEVFEDDGNYGFKPAGDFADFGGSDEEIHSAVLAQDLAAYARTNALAGITQEIGQDGTVSFADLELGLYLLVQEQAADGYSEASPFLVSVPNMEDGVYVYDVDASPKVELTPEPTQPPTEPPPTEPTDPELPQTGQLNWPIPVLVAAGLTLFIVGWVLCFTQRKDRYEK